MTTFYWAIVAAGPCALMTVGLFPIGWANQHAASLLRAGVSWLMAATFAISVFAAGMLVLVGPLDCELLSLPWGVNIGFYFDSLAALLLPLIGFIGLIIARYSVVYLEGEPGQGRFLQWMSLTLGAVMLLIVARNLLMFTAAWMVTSYGLHKLLTHYPDRPWALWAARKKFLISRLGDAFLLGALVLTFQEFGSFDYSVIFEAAEARRHSLDGPGVAATWIGILFVLGAMTKSAQFPFHSWLPDTMETPTPVSALMHAGVINAGGILVIRLSPLVSLSSAGLGLLAIVGAITALFAAVVMQTQTSVKRMLAWSTIAQMGFMMLQCGLGAFSAALLHIIAHSLYKAHAFLISGSVLDLAARIRTVDRPTVSRTGHWATLPVTLTCSAGLLASFGWILGIDLLAKPGFSVIGLVMIVALTQLIWPALNSGVGWIVVRSIGLSGFICLAYLLAFQAIDGVLASSLPRASLDLGLIEGLVLGSVASGFLVMFWLQTVTNGQAVGSALRSLYVHAANGFYLDVPARRVTAFVWRETSPTP